MDNVLPVQAFRYDPLQVGDLAPVLAPPYDVIGPDEQRDLHERHPDNVVRLILGYQHDTDTDDDNRYTRSAAELRRLLGTGAIRRDDRPAFYVYEQTFTRGERRVTRRGIVGRWRIQDEGGLLAHEKTLDGPKQDRFRLFRACKVVCSQVFTFYSDPQRQVDAVLAEDGVMEPATAFTGRDGVEHRLSRVTREDAVARLSGILSSFPQYIADGHHRFETTKNYRKARMAELGGKVTGEEPFHFASVYMANTHQDGLVILPIERLLHGVEGFDGAALMRALAAECDITPMDGDIKAVDAALEEAGKAGPSFALYLRDGGWRILRVRPEAHAAFVRDCGLHPTVAVLDVSWLHQRVLTGLLGITKEAQAAQTNLDYGHTLEEVQEALDRDPKYQAAVLLNQVPVQQVQDVAAAGQRMPQKSTFFFPKIISGLVIHPLEEQVP
jgi:uncharacterized protein (DUF1015 family)